MSRRRRPERLDFGQVALVAARTTGLDVSELLATTDLTLLAMITQRTRASESPAEAAAEILVGVAAGRPFPIQNCAVAWALAALVADNHRLRLQMPASRAVELVRSAAAGRIDEAAMAGELQGSLRRGGRRREPLAAPLGTPAQRTVTVWACPTCGRPVSLPPFRSSILVADPLPTDVIADCASRYRGHGPSGVVRRYDAAKRYEAPSLAGAS